MSNQGLSASERIACLLDDSSFVEVGAYVEARSTDFNIPNCETPKDGVITGYGLIGNKLVYVYSQDASVLGGAVGEMHAKKISNIYNMAMKVGATVIGLIDSAGIRLQEATDALNAFSRLYLKQTMASGVIPQVTAIFGNCGGGAAIIPAGWALSLRMRSHSSIRAVGALPKANSASGCSSTARRMPACVLVIPIEAAISATRGSLR